MKNFLSGARTHLSVELSPESSITIFFSLGFCWLFMILVITKPYKEIGIKGV